MPAGLLPKVLPANQVSYSSDPPPSFSTILAEIYYANLIQPQSAADEPELTLLAG
jgi:hypothetical protein